MKRAAREARGEPEVAGSQVAGRAVSHVARPSDCLQTLGGGVRGLPWAPGGGARRASAPAPATGAAGCRHHLDLVVGLDRPPPAAGPLAEVRRVLTGLLGHFLPSAWDDATAARRSTGRAPLDDDDRAALGGLAGASLCSAEAPGTAPPTVPPAGSAGRMPPWT